MKRTVLIYLALLTVFGLGIFLTIQQGRRLPQPPPTNATINGGAIPAGAAGATSADNWRQPFRANFILGLAVPMP